MLRQLCVPFKQTGLRHSGPDLIEDCYFLRARNDQQPACEQREGSPAETASISGAFGGPAKAKPEAPANSIIIPKMLRIFLRDYPILTEVRPPYFLRARMISSPPASSARAPPAETASISGAFGTAPAKAKLEAPANSSIIPKMLRIFLRDCPILTEVRPPYFLRARMISSPPASRARAPPAETASISGAFGTPPAKAKLEAPTNSSIIPKMLRIFLRDCPKTRTAVLADETLEVYTKLPHLESLRRKNKRTGTNTPVPCSLRIKMKA